MNFELGDADCLRLFAGRSDPNDVTRLTIPYDLNGETGVIEGVQRSNGSLLLRVIEGPLKVQQPNG